VTSPVNEGDVLAGKYRVDKVLGLGGMGVVVAAHHIQLDDKVAIKFLLPESLANSEAVARFGREARAAVKIKSEHVARVTDVGTLENGAPYMVMEYLDGTDLAGWLKQRGPLPIEQAVDFLLQACEAIAEAHALGIVHRDLKPANLFVIRLPDGAYSVKVLDFGISKISGIGGAASDMTRTSALMGSPLYMSPEQMQSSKDADSRSDIWALGVVLYELLTADSPFVADTMPELVVKILTVPPPPLRNKRPDAPNGLEAVIVKCVNKDRGLRFQTVGELAVALLEFAPRRSKVSVEKIAGVLKAAGLSKSALALPVSSEGDSVRASAGTAASWGSTARGSGGSRTALFLGGGIVIAVIAIAAMVAVALKRSSSLENPVVAATGAPSIAPAQSVLGSPAPPPSAASAASAPSGASTPPVETKPPSSASGAAPAPVPTAARVRVPPPAATPPPKALESPMAAHPSSPKRDCNPNFFLDAQGEKHFKPECF